MRSSMDGTSYNLPYKQTKHTHTKMQSRLGLSQTPKGPARVRAAPKAPPKREGPLWGTVQVLTEHATARRPSSA